MPVVMPGFPAVGVPIQHQPVFYHDNSSGDMMGGAGADDDTSGGYGGGGFSGRGRGRGRGRGGSSGGEADSGLGRGRPGKPGEWICPSVDCGNANFARRTTCNRCGVAKPRAVGQGNVPVGKEMAEASKGMFSANDWQCSKCGNVNWQKRSTCNMCNNPRDAAPEVRNG
jgi:hypothetical protein